MLNSVKNTNGEENSRIHLENANGVLQRSVIQIQKFQYGKFIISLRDGYPKEIILLLRQHGGLKVGHIKIANWTLDANVLK